MAFAFHILGTSSSGNCSLLEAGGTRMMLDAGFQGPRLEASLQKLGIEARALDAVFITHEHADHCVGLPALLRQNPMLKVFARPAKRLTWLTDLGHATPVVKHHVALADILVLEANYDDEMLDLSKRPASLKQRIRGNFGHLSNVQTKDLLLSLREWQTTELYLGHLSKECNRTIIVDALMNEVRAQKTDLRITVVDPLEDNPVSLW